MERSVGMERTFVLGQFKNIKLSDYISNIPEEIALNTNAMGLLRQLQIIQIDKTYLMYLKKTVTLTDRYKTDPQALEDTIAELDEARISTLESLIETVASVQTENATEEKEE